MLVGEAMPEVAEASEAILVNYYVQTHVNKLALT